LAATLAPILPQAAAVNEMMTVAKDVGVIDTITSGMDDVLPSVSLSSGYTALEGQQAQQATAAKDIVNVDSHDVDTVSDVEWDIKALMGKPMLFNRMSWSTSDAFSQITFVPIVLSDVYRLVSLMGRFRYWRGNMTFRIHVTSTNFHSGKGRIIYIPPLAPNTSRNSTYSFNRLWSMPCLEIAANSPGLHELKVPFTNQLHFYERNSTIGPDYGQIAFIVTHPLSVPETVPSTVTLVFTLILDDVSVRVPSNNAVALPEVANVQFYNNESVIGPLTLDDFDDMPETQASNSLTPVTDRVKLSSFNPFLIDGEFLPLPKLGNSTPGTGDASKLSGEEHDDSILNFCKRFGYFNNIAWTTAQTPNTQLMFWRNTPVGALGGCPPIKYASLCAQYWRGSLTYKVRISKPRFAQGKLIVTYTPRGQVISATTEADMEKYVLVVDISETTEFMFTIPYMDDMEWKTVGDPNVNSYLYNTGTVTIKVHNSLMMPASSTSSIILYMEMCAGPDFQLANPIEPQLSFAVPTNVFTTEYLGGPAFTDYMSTMGTFSTREDAINWLDTTLYAVLSPDIAVTQSGVYAETSSLQNNDTDLGFILGSKNSVTVNNKLTRPDEITTISSLLRRPFKDVQIAKTNKKYNLALTCQTNSNSFLFHFSKCYLFWQGDLNFHMMQLDDSSPDFNLVYNTYYATNYDRQAGNGDGSGIPPNGGTSTIIGDINYSDIVAMNVPLITKPPIMYTYPRRVNSDLMNNWRASGGTLTYKNALGTNVIVYRSAGPNLKFYRFIGIPELADIGFEFIRGLLLDYYDSGATGHAMIDILITKQISLNLMNNNGTMTNLINQIQSAFPSTDLANVLAPNQLSYLGLLKLDDNDSDDENGHDVTGTGKMVARARR